MSVPSFPDPLNQRELLNPGATANKAGLTLEERVKALEQGALSIPGPNIATGAVPTRYSAGVGNIAWRGGAQVFTASGSISAGGAHTVTFTGAASQTLTLPAASIGDWYYVLNIDGSDTVDVARVGSDTINGGTSVTVGPGDGARIICTAAATWVAIFDRFPWKARMSLSAAFSHDSSGNRQKVGKTTGSWAATYDVRPNGASAQVDTSTNRRIDIRRAGLYLIQANVSFTGIGTSTTLTAGYVYMNGVARMVATGYAWTTAGIRTHYMSGSGGLSVGDYLELYAFQDESASEAYSYDGLGTTLHNTYLSVQWLGPNGSG